MTPFRRFLKLIPLTFNQIFFHSKNPHEYPRDHNHLDDQYRRMILAPDSASSHLIRLLLADTYFTQLLELRHPQHLVRACIVGDELRANIYELARFPCGLMVPAHNESWRKDGVLDYYIEAVDEGDAETDKFDIRPIHNPEDVDHTLTYDVYEPVRSYARLLTREELAQVNCYSRPQWSKVA